MTVRLPIKTYIARVRDLFLCILLAACQNGNAKAGPHLLERTDTLHLLELTGLDAAYLQLSEAPSSVANKKQIATFVFNAKSSDGTDEKIQVSVNTHTGAGFVRIGTREVRFTGAGKDKINVPIELSGHVDLLVTDFQVYLRVRSNSATIAAVTGGYEEHENFTIDPEISKRLSGWIFGLQVPWTPPPTQPAN